MGALVGSARVAVDEAAWADLVGAIEPEGLGFASIDDVESMAGRVRALVGTHTGGSTPGQTAYLRLSPGTVGLRARTLRTMDVAPDAAAAAERGYREHIAAMVRQLHREHLVPDGWDPAVELTMAGAPAPAWSQEPERRRVREWSRRSRSRMAERIAELDYSGWAGDGTLGMVTLSIPGPWEVIAPDGRTFKGLVDKFRKRCVRAGMVWRGLWKLEFQGRGAPHMHMLLRVPTMVGSEKWEWWAARAWADIVRDAVPASERAMYDSEGHYFKHLGHGVDVSFSGVKFSDPRRTAIYFSKHGSKTLDDKEYQHIVPAAWRGEGKGPGRFWGYWGLDRATVEVEVDWTAFVAARRVLRHVARARQAAVALSRLRADGGDVRDLRRPRRRGGFGASGGGWVLVHDGVQLAWDLARYLDGLDR
ncbi:MAG TPA: hypothetical protein VGC67_01890 [Cellulomonas sp.]